jgi:hypothetical protein
VFSSEGAEAAFICHKGWAKFISQTDRGSSWVGDLIHTLVDLAEVYESTYYLPSNFKWF